VSMKVYEENEDSNLLVRRKNFSIHLILKKKEEASSLLDTNAWEALITRQEIYMLDEKSTTFQNTKSRHWHR
jgi:hypothetical protein